MQKILNAHIKIFEVAHSFKGFHHGKERKKKQRTLLQNSRGKTDKCASDIIVQVNSIDRSRKPTHHMFN